MMHHAHGGIVLAIILLAILVGALLESKSGPP